MDLHKAISQLDEINKVKNEIILSESFEKIVEQFKDVEITQLTINETQIQMQWGGSKHWKTAMEHFVKGIKKDKAKKVKELEQKIVDMLKSHLKL